MYTCTLLIIVASRMQQNPQEKDGCALVEMKNSEVVEGLLQYMTQPYFAGLVFLLWLFRTKVTARNETQIFSLL